MTNGWIKLHRQLWKNPRASNSNWLSVWIWLLHHAVFSETDVIWKGQRITLKPGQLTTGRFDISRATGVSASTVNRIIQTLKSEHQIEQQTSSVCSLITILNWDKYQESEQQSGQRTDSERTASEQQMDTKEEGEEGEEGKNTLELALGVVSKPKSEFPPELDTPEFRASWAEFEQHRKQKHKTLTPLAIKKQFAQLAKLGPQKAIEAINHSIANGYTGIFSPNTNSTYEQGKPKPYINANIGNANEGRENEYEGIGRPGCKIATVKMG